MKVKCSACGINMQNFNQDEIGYTTNLENGLCKRCFRIKNYGEVIPYSVSEIDYQNMLDEIKTNDYLYIIVDIFNPEFEYFERIASKLNQPFSIIVTKKDLLPKQISERKISKFIEASLEYQIEKIFVSSANKKINIDAIIDNILSKKAKNIYFLGVANAGKSSLVNAIINALSLKKIDPILVANYPGTTCYNIQIQIDNKFIYDTPGYKNQETLLNYVQPKIINKIIPKHEIKPITFQLNDDQTIFIGDFAYFEYYEGEKSGFTFNFSPYINLHRTKTLNKDDYMKTHLNYINNVKTKTISFLNKNENIDLYISGLGFISFKKGTQNIKITIPEVVNLTIRKSIY